MAKLISVSRAARELGISGISLRRKILEGRIPAYRFGPKLTRIDLDEVKKKTRVTAQKQQE